jgi:hypothetical protein
MHPIHAAIYARVSSEPQAEAHTIASQVAARRERLSPDGLVVPAGMEFLDDGYSGRPWCVQPLSVCVMRRRRASSTGSMSIRPIGWPANMPIRSYWLTNWGALAWRSSSSTANEGVARKMLCGSRCQG